VPSGTYTAQRRKNGKSAPAVVCRAVETVT